MNQLPIIAPQVKKAIDQSKNILLHCHPGPDPDSYGSALAMYHYLNSIGKMATVIGGDSPIPDFVEFLPGGDKVVAKNYLEIDPSQYDLFIILDVSKAERISTMGPVIIPSTMRTVLIDHHISSGAWAELTWSDESYPATAQMLFDLFTEWQVAITHDMAWCLMLGMYTDTGGFKYNSTNPGTFRAAARLAEIAPDYTKLIFNLENNNAPGSIKLQGLALSNVETHWDRVAISTLSYEQIQAGGIGENDSRAVTIANILKSVTGWDIGIHLFEWEPGVTKLSCRTRDPEQFDLSKFTGLLGGGGHRAAAGAQIRKPLALALTEVLKALGQAYPQLR